MKVLEYTPFAMNEVVYKLQEAEVLFQKAKDEYEVLDEKEDDLLATLVCELQRDNDLSQVKAQAQARNSQRWIDFKNGKYEAKREYGNCAVVFRHLLRVLNCIEKGMSYNQTLTKKGIYDAGK